MKAAGVPTVPKRVVEAKSLKVYSDIVFTCDLPSVEAEYKIWLFYNIQLCFSQAYQFILAESLFVNKQVLPAAKTCFHSVYLVHSNYLTLPEDCPGQK